VKNSGSSLNGIYLNKIKFLKLLPSCKSVHPLRIYYLNWRINGQSICQTIWINIMSDKESLHYVITYNVIWANQKTESYVYCWLRALAMFDVMRFPTFVRASDVISSVLSIHSFSPCSYTGNMQIFTYTSYKTCQSCVIYILILIVIIFFISLWFSITWKITSNKQI